MKHTYKTWGPFTFCVIDFRKDVAPDRWKGGISATIRFTATDCRSKSLIVHIGPVQYELRLGATKQPIKE